MRLRHFICLLLLFFFLSGCSKKEDVSFSTINPMASQETTELLFQGEDSVPSETHPISSSETPSDLFLPPTEQEGMSSPIETTLSNTPTESPKATSPTNPTTATETSHPTVPTASVNPTESQNSTTPTETLQSTTPTEPPTPTTPTESSQPTTPTEPTKPTDPTEPTKPTTPTESQPTETPAYTVRFLDYDGTILHSQEVLSGEDAILPPDPFRSAYVFAGWMGEYHNIREDCTIRATYVEADAPNLFCIENQVVGNQVLVKISLSGTICTAGFQCFLDYDESLLQYQSMKKHNGIEANAVHLKNNSRIALAWANSVNMTNDTIRDDGLLLELTFFLTEDSARNSLLFFMQEGFTVESVDESGSYTQEPYTYIRSVIHIP